MIDIKDSKTIKIIQGESLTAIFSVDDTYADVSSATFVCKDLDLEIGLILKRLLNQQHIFRLLNQ